MLKITKKSDPLKFSLNNANNYEPPSLDMSDQFKFLQVSKFGESKSKLIFGTQMMAIIFPCI